MIKENSLLPCPFCGSEGVFNIEHKIDREWVAWTTYKVQCTSCIASTQVGAYKGLDEEHFTHQVINSWNTRV